MKKLSSIIVQVVIGLVAIVLVSRLYYLQIVDVKYKDEAYRSGFKKKIEYPYRGVIYDRNGKLLVANEPTLDLVVTVKQARGIDTVALCEVLKISKEEFVARGKEIRKERGYSPVKPYPFLKQFSVEEYARIQDRFRFEGFEFVPRIERTYPFDGLSNSFGYIAEISSRELGSNKFYLQGDYIGKTGIEKKYEKELRGSRGFSYVKVSARGAEMGAFMEGSFDTLPVSGHDLISSIDADLQAYGEQLMKGKIGSVVAIEPKTGEVLAIVSAPTYSPSLLKGKAYSDNFRALSRDTLKPLFDRATQAAYPPGSIFKMIQAGIAMQEKLITPTQRTYVKRYPNMGDHSPSGTYTVKDAIRVSSNWYFAWLYKKLLERGTFKSQYKDTYHNYEIWRNYVRSFGLGGRLGTDFPQEKGGSVPDRAMYDRWYNNKPWKASNIISNAIGQGELLVIPIQMANLAAIIANHGYYYTPHFIKEVKGDISGVLDKYKVRHKTLVDSIYFEPIIDAMQTVVENGTARRARTKDIVVCGKTGTAENPHGEDHSVFIAFAPRDNPQIAIAVYVENAGYGGTWAAPISSLMIEKYLKKEISNKFKEKRILEKDFINEK